MTSPVTENEVPALQDFFQRISSTIVAHSQQARELQQLQSQMQELSNRLNSLQAESTNLRADLSSAWTAYEQCKAERDTAKADAEIAARDAMAARTETVNVRMEFEQKLGVANDQIHARDERIAELEDRLLARTKETNDWQARSNRYETLAKESEWKLATAQDKLNEVLSIFKPKEPVAQKPLEPDPMAENVSQRVINF